MGNLAYHIYMDTFFIHFILFFSGRGREGGYVVLTRKIQMCYLEWQHFCKKKKKWQKMPNYPYGQLGTFAWVILLFFFFFFSGQCREWSCIVLKDKIQKCYLEWQHSCINKIYIYISSCPYGQLGIFVCILFFIHIFSSGWGREGGCIVFKDKIQMCYLEEQHFYTKIVKKKYTKLPILATWYTFLSFFICILLPVLVGCVKGVVLPLKDSIYIMLLILVSLLYQIRKQNIYIYYIYI